MSQVPHQKTEQTTGQQEEERKKFPDPWMTEIVPGLFLGDGPASICAEMLQKNHISAIVSLYECQTGWVPAMLLSGKSPDHRIFIQCEDSPTLDLLVYMSDICDFIDQMASPVLRQSSSPQSPSLQSPSLQSSSLQFSSAPNPTDSVLVHCRAGRSRSPTVIIAYLMRKYHITYEDTLKFVRTKRRVKPSATLVRQLRIWEEVGYNVWEDDERMIPKPPYRAYLDDRTVQMDGAKDNYAISNAKGALYALYPIGPKYEPPYCCQIDPNCPCKGTAFTTITKCVE